LTLLARSTVLAIRNRIARLAIRSITGMDTAADNLVVGTAAEVQPIRGAARTIGRIAGIFHLNIEVVKLKAGFSNGLDGYEAAGIGFGGAAEAA
jgi:hypothetical protein